MSTPRKPAGETRILGVGDSFTYGEAVRDEETFCAVLDRLIPEATVLNFGVHGYGVDQMLLRLRRDAMRYQPDIVVVGVFFPDADRNLLSFRDYAKPRFHLAGGQLELTNVPVPTPNEILASPFTGTPRSYLASLAAKQWQRLWSHTRFAAHDRWHKQRELLLLKLLTEIHATVRTENAHMVLLLLPADFGHYQPIATACKNWARANHVTVADMEVVWGQLDADDRQRLAWVTHISPFGHESVAQELRRVILADSLLSE